MIIRETEQMPVFIQCPAFRPELPLEGMGDFEQIAGIEAGIKPFIALIIGDAVRSESPSSRL